MSDTARVALALWLAALVLHLAGLGIEPLRDWDEGAFAQVAREIREGGPARLLHPTLWGEPYLNTPTLGPGLMAASFAAFGESPFAARLPGAVLSASSAPLLYLLALVAGAGRARALAAGLVFLTLLPAMRHGRLAMLDATVVFFALLMLLCLAAAAREDRAGPAFGAGLAAAGMALTKGLLAAPLLAVGLIWLAVQRTPALRRGRFHAALALGLALALAWYAAQALRYGDLFTRSAVVDQGLARLCRGVEGNAGPPRYHLLETSNTAGPGSCSCPPGSPSPGPPAAPPGPRWR